MNSSAVFGALVVLLVVALVPEKCHGVQLHHYNRAYWGAKPAKVTLKVSAELVTEVVLIPTDTEYCGTPDSGPCAPLMKKIQDKNMAANYNDIGYNYVIGGCTGIFEGAGWRNVAPFSNGHSRMVIGLAGRYTDQDAGAHIIQTTKNLIDEGIDKKMIHPDYTLKCQSVVNGAPCPKKFVDDFAAKLKPMQTEYFSDYDVYIPPQ